MERERERNGQRQKQNSNNYILYFVNFFYFVNNFILTRDCELKQITITF